MSETPSVNTVGYTVAEAVKKAAAQLNVEPMLVRWELDTSHFRNEEGRRVPRDTVAIIATALDASAVDGANACRDWVAGLLERMEVEATVTSKLDGDKRVTISIDSPRARHLVGRRGVTLQAIVQLMEATLARTEHADWQFRLDIQGGRDRDERDDRDDRRDRGDRGDRGDRRGRGRDRDRDGRRSKKNPDKLKSLAVRLAEQAIEKGEAIVIRQELNSYERRIVHVAIQDMEGVSSESIGDGSVKQIRLVPDGYEE